LASAVCRFVWADCILEKQKGLFEIRVSDDKDDIVPAMKNINQAAAAATSASAAQVGTAL